MKAKYWIRILVLNLFLFFSAGVLADLILFEGGPSGQWFNPSRNGEGFFVEINDGSTTQISIAMYSYDENGNPLWLVASGAIDANDTTFTLTLLAFDGPVWGPGYDPGDLNEIPFGTITGRFPDCDTALFSIQSNGALQSGSYSLIRLTNVKGASCTEPPNPPSGITSGKWSGLGVCFMVSDDGKSIVGGNLSECDAQLAFDSNLEGISNALDECNVNAGCEGVWPIVDGKFSCANNQGELATGTFNSKTGASGFAYEDAAGEGEYCTAEWTASPE